ncbi:transcriptional regulator [Klebsiella quasipneumoniae]|nr:transcriptional regulator [Klebsiella quasipneumoniae]
MLFLINNVLWFRDDDCMLYTNDNAFSVTLTATTSRLLHYLLERHGEIVSRDELLDNVWEAYGLNASNNSLNKYISDLRRYLATAGVGSEVIVTVPKIGFMISQDVIVDKKNSQIKQETTDTKLDKKFFLYSKRFNFKKFRFCLYALIILTLIIVVFDFVNKDLVAENTLYYKFSINSCDVYSLSNANNDNKEENIEKINKLLKNKNTQCMKDEVVIYDFNDNDIPKRNFLAKCKVKKSDSVKIFMFTNCDNYYEINYSS